MSVKQIEHSIYSFQQFTIDFQTFEVHPSKLPWQTL